MKLQTHLVQAFATVALASALGVAIFGCTQSIENKIDCNAICNRYRDCFNASYDTSTCNARCESGAKNESGFESKVNVCAACIDDKSCVSATFTCGSECSAIVP